MPALPEEEDGRVHYTELLQARRELTGPGGVFEIVEAEVLGHRLRTYKNVPASVRDLWLSTAQFGERPHLVYQDERLSYHDAHERVNAVAAWLWGQGVRRGDRVAIAMRNYPEWLLVYWACVSIGVAAVGMNAWWTGEELAYALVDSQPKVMFLDAERLARFSERPELAGTVSIVGARLSDAELRASPSVTPWEQVIAHGGAMPEVWVDPDDDACIFYTSGTTGFPGTVRISVCGRAVEHYAAMALMKRSPKITAN